MDKTKMTTEKDLQQKYIGRIIVAFNFLDWYINDFIGWIISTDASIGQIVTAHIKSNTQRLNLLFSLYKNQASQLKWFTSPISKDVFIQRDEMVKGMHNWIQKAHEVNGKRNKIIHSIWFQQQRHIEELGDEAPMIGLGVSAEKSKLIEGGKVGLKYEVVSYSSAELESYAIEIEALTQGLVKLKESTQELIEKK